MGTRVIAVLAALSVVLACREFLSAVGDKASAELRACVSLDSVLTDTLLVPLNVPRIGWRTDTLLPGDTVPGRALCAGPRVPLQGVP